MNNYIMPVLDNIPTVFSHAYFVNFFIKNYPGEVPQNFKVSIKTDFKKLIEKIESQFQIELVYSLTKKTKKFYREGSTSVYKLTKSEVFFMIDDSNDEYPYSVDDDITEVYSELKNGNFYTDDIVILSTQKFTNKARELFDLAAQIKPVKPKQQNKINIISQNQDEGMYLKSFDIKKPKLDLQSNYNNDFLDFHNTVIDKINKENSDGIVLLYGPPGCGKTNYIKFLLTKLNKKMIYLPPNLSNEISSPSFIEFLSSHPDSTLIIEDAENIMKSRRGGGNQAISNLLNLSNGLLSDILKIQIIATFNCPITDIDSALLRKGRLIAKYEFNKLKADKAQQLSDKLNLNTVINQDMTLAEIYNQNDKDFKEDKPVVGFKFNK